MQSERWQVARMCSTLRLNNLLTNEPLFSSEVVTATRLCAAKLSSFSNITIRRDFIKSPAFEVAPDSWPVTRRHWSVNTSAAIEWTPSPGSAGWA